MMELGLSTSILGPRALPEGLAILADHRIPWVEIHGYELEEFDFTDRALVEATARALELSKLRVWSCHSPAYEPLDLASLDHELRTRSIIAMDEAMLVSAQLRARVFVCDAVGQPPSDPQTHPKRRVLFAEGLHHLLDRTTQLGLRLVIENHTPRGGVFVTPQDFLNFIADHGLADLGVCWDTGHARLTGQPAEVACGLGAHLLTLHLHDNDGRRDLHQLPADGGIAWKPLIDCLGRIGYGGPFMMELAPSEPPTPEAIGRLVGQAVDVYHRLLG